MKMTVEEALELLEIDDMPVTHEMVKSSHRRLLSRYHPDRNPGGHQITQMINVARDFLFGQPDPIPQYSNESYSHSYQKAYQKAYQEEVIHVRGMKVRKQYGTTIVSGDTFRFKEVLKENCFRWSPEDKHWWLDEICDIEDYLAQSIVY
jgi:hypothetical protein